MEQFFQPRSLALVGASSRPKSLSAVLLNNLVAGGYRGALCLVNPHAEVIGGLRCYARVGDLPSPVDLALLMVPARDTEEALRQCADRGIRHVVVIAAGFRETGDEGSARERRIGRLARQRGVRLIGPNSMGLMNLDPAVRLNATFSPAAPRAGSVAFVTQSGALGVAIQTIADPWGLGFSQFASLGNEADVNAAELLEYCVAQPATRVVVLYLESLEHGRRLLECGRRLCRQKPLVLLHSGRTSAGAAAAASHTGALAARPGMAEGIFERAGFLVAHSLEEMLEMAVAFSLGTPAAGSGRSIAVLTNAGGPGVLATDAAVAAGLELAALRPETMEALRQCTPREASVRNPVDLLPAASDEMYACSAGKLLADPAVEQLLVLKVSSPLGPSGPGFLDRLAALQGESGKPVIAALMVAPDSTEGLASRPLPCFWFPEAAARAAAALARYAELRQFAAAPVSHTAVPTQTTLPACPPVLPQLFELLAAYGIDSAPSLAARGLEEAVAFAERCGYPVALKTLDPEIVHKTEAGGVSLDLRSRDELCRAFPTIPGAAVRGVLVQKFVRGQHREVLAGFLREPCLGPLLAFGLGGTLVEALGQVAYLALPASEAEVRRLLGALPAASLLGAFRGKPPVNTARLVQVLLALAQLGLEHPEVAALEINPLLAGTAGEETLAVDARLVLLQPAEQTLPAACADSAD